jgi:general secretion pathway protein A
MFLDFYRLKEQPFGVTPDPRFLYMSETHREALASLFYGVKSGRGFMALVAKPGMGKTSLLFRLMQNLEPTARTVFLFQTQCDSREFLKYLLADMGIQSDSTDLVKMHSQLNETLAENAKTGKQLVVIVDEAQNLDPSVLETIRLLSDFETSRQKLLQIVLSGQLQLAEKLASPSLVQLSQRISILSRLRPFSTEETAAYIQHRLAVAGYSGEPLFSAAAVELIADLSQGIPRNINNLCFNALSWGYAVKKDEISAEIVKDVAADMSIFYRPEVAAPDVAPPPPAVAEPAIAVKSEAEAEKIPIVAPTLGLGSMPTRDGRDLSEPPRASHSVRNAALAACVVAAAFLAGYGWQNYHRATEPRPREAQAELVPPKAPAAKQVSGENSGMTGVAKPSPESKGGKPLGNATVAAEPRVARPSLAVIPKADIQRGLSPAPDVSAEMNGKVKAVIVKRNDTLWKLSQQYSPPGATADNFYSITSLNNLPDPNHIEAGQRLLLPVEPKGGLGASPGGGPPAKKKAKAGRDSTTGDAPPSTNMTNPSAGASSPGGRVL